MNYTFCTVITKDFLYQALSLFDSLQRIDNDVQLTILVVDDGNLEPLDVPKGVNLLSIFQVQEMEHAESIINKYYTMNQDALRWSLKPVLMHFLLEKEGYDKVFFADSDLYFFNSYQFLLAELDTYSLLLSPHWRSKDPVKDNPNFHLNFTEGLFNGGFIGVTNRSIPFLNWWAKSCAYTCEVNKEKGMYVDQKYLDAAMVFFDKVGVIKHQGCNVANWNLLECKRTLSDNEEVLINNEFPIIFIHFTNSTIKGILGEADPLLSPYLKIHLDNLKKYKTDLTLDKFYKTRLRKGIPPGKKNRLKVKTANLPSIRHIVKILFFKGSF